jgi:hypothetical protein
MSLEQKYVNADAHEQATVEKIHRACATFMQAHPEYLASAQNEDIMFAAMTAPENDHLKPTRAADWEEIFAQVRNQLEEKPRRQQRATRTGITHEALDNMSAEEMGRRMNDPNFVNAVNSIPPRKN